MKTLPLGVDLGSSRIRAVLTVQSATGPRVSAVSTRDVPSGAMLARVPCDVEYVAALVEDAVHDLHTGERRCIGAIGMPAASLRSIQLPPMSYVERERTARFEAARHIEYPLADATVRMCPIDSEARRWALGIIRTETLVKYSMVFKRSGLRLQAIQDEGCALRQAFSGFDAIVDIGFETSTLYLAKALEAFQVPIGGQHITKAIAADLHIDESSAEKRKRILGTAGAGNNAKNALLEGVGALVNAGKAVHQVQSVALTGNGSRLPGLSSEIASATGIPCAIPVSARLQRSEAYPKDVIVSSAPDWTLGVAIAGSDP